MAKTRHIGTGYISLQFHVIFDDLFETVNLEGNFGSTIQMIWINIFYINRDWYNKEEFENGGNIIYQPSPLHNIWLPSYWSQQLALSIICKYDWSVSRFCHSFKLVQNRSKSFKDILVRFNVSKTCVYYDLIG